MQQLQSGWPVTSERENNAPFPKPWGPVTGAALGGESKTRTDILSWFTAAGGNEAPRYLYRVGRGRAQ